MNEKHAQEEAAADARAAYEERVRARHEAEAAAAEAKPAPSTDTTKHQYQCIICGHTVEVEGNLPDDYVCPLCKASKDKFERVMK